MNKRNLHPWARLTGALVVLGGLWLLTVWLLSATPSSARGGLPALLTLQSPIGDPQPNIVKEADVSQAQPGDEIEYTIAYSTTTPGSRVFDVRLYDFLPAGATFVSSNPPATRVDNGVLLFTFPSVGADTVTATVRVRVQEGYEQIVNYTLATADQITPVYASLLTQVDQPTTWLRLTKTGYEHVLAGQELAYTLRCKNDSGVAVRDVTVADVLPTGLVPLAASPPPDETTPPLLTWSLGTLAPGEERTIAVTVTAPAEATVITNTALASGQRRAMTSTLFATQVVTEAAILDVSKTASASTVDVGDDLVYTIRYRNIGNRPAVSATLTDTLPASVSVKGVSPVTTTVGGSGQLIWHLGTVPTGTAAGTVVVTVTVIGNWDGTLHNTVAIGAPDSFGSQATVDVDVRPFRIYLPILRRSGRWGWGLVTDGR